MLRHSPQARDEEAARRVARRQRLHERAVCRVRGSADTRRPDRPAPTTAVGPARRAPACASEAFDHLERLGAGQRADGVGEAPPGATSAAARGKQTPLQRGEASHVDRPAPPAQVGPRGQRAQAASTARRAARPRRRRAGSGRRPARARRARRPRPARPRPDGRGSRAAPRRGRGSSSTASMRAAGSSAASCEALPPGAAQRSATRPAAAGVERPGRDQGDELRGARLRRDETLGERRRSTRAAPPSISSASGVAGGSPATAAGRATMPSAASAAWAWRAWPAGG